MKRSLIVVLAATFASVAFAANDQYRNDAGEQDQASPIASAEQYRNNAGEQDLATPIAANDAYRNDAGEQDLHQPQVADAGEGAGEKSRNSQNYPQLG